MCINVCVVASGFARWSMSVCVCGCIWLRQMSLLIAPMAPLADKFANLYMYTMSLTTSKQARQANIKDLKRVIVNFFGEKLNFFPKRVVRKFLLEKSEETPRPGLRPCSRRRSFPHLYL